MNQKQYIGKKIREFRNKKGWTAEMLGNKLSKPKTFRAILSWENGRTTPDSDVLIELCILFGVEIDDFYYKPPEYRYSVVSLDDREWIKVPFYGSVAGGTPIEMIEDKDFKDAPAQFIEEDPDCFFVRVKGDSENRRHIFDGDYALISSKFKDPQPGELYLVAVNGDEATIKEVNVLQNGVELIPDSYDPTYERMIFNFNDSDTPPVTILGKVVWHCAPF